MSRIKLVVHERYLEQTDEREIAIKNKKEKLEKNLETETIEKNNENINKEEILENEPSLSTELEKESFHQL